MTGSGRRIDALAKPSGNVPSLSRNSRGLDDSGPFLDLALNVFLKILRRSALRRDKIVADLLHLLTHGRIIHDLDRDVVELRDDRRRSRLGKEKRKPCRGIKIGKALFTCRGERG